MSKPTRSVNSIRLASEGAVIVLSILLAFAIDAWWNEWQERNAKIEQLARVSTELVSNAENIHEKLETLAVAIDATSQFISWMGPEPSSVETQVLLDEWDKLYGIGNFTLSKGASQDYLAVGRITGASNAKVHHAVAQWYSHADKLEKQYDLLRVAHSSIMENLFETMPALHLVGNHPLMADHPKSKFLFDQATLLSDPRMESRLSVYLIRMEFVTEWARYLLEQQSSLLILIESTE
jgi:hypothetical protein